MKTIPKYSMLLFLALIFALPGMAAYFFYLHPTYLGAARVNQGTLLQPILPLKTQALPGWQVVFWSPDTCDTACLKQLDTLARVRLALGRRSYEVQLILLLGKESKPLQQGMQDVLKTRAIGIEKVNPEVQQSLQNLSSGPRIFIANPEHAAILSYADNCSPKAVYLDLQRLLTTAQSQKSAM
jgi:hypothetical protein